MGDGILIVIVFILGIFLGWKTENNNCKIQMMELINGSSTHDLH